MGRFYSDGDDFTAEERADWKRSLEQMIREPKGQAFLRAIKRGMEALPERKLIRQGLYHRVEVDLPDGAEGELPVKEEACALGATLRLQIVEGGVVVRHRDPKTGFVSAIKTLDELNTDAGWLDEDGYEHSVWASHTFDVPEELTWHIGWMNDELWESQTPEVRYQRMMAWVKKHLVSEVPA